VDGQADLGLLRPPLHHFPRLVGGLLVDPQNEMIDLPYDGLEKGGDSERRSVCGTWV
jgi:hypothetical protein